MSMSAGNNSTLGQHFSLARPSMSPAPLVHQNSYGSQGSGSHVAVPQSYQQGNNFSQYNALSPGAMAQPANNMMTFDSMPPTQSGTYRPATQSSSYNGNSNAYNPPRQSEAYVLSDEDNAKIPADIRSQFPCDDEGRVLFFTNPPFVTDDEEELEPPRPPLRELAEQSRAENARKLEEAEHARKLKEAGVVEWDPVRMAQLKEILERNGGKHMPTPELSKELQNLVSAQLALRKKMNPNYLQDTLAQLRKQAEQKKERKALEEQLEWVRNNPEQAMKNYIAKYDDDTNQMFKKWYGDNWKEMRAQSDARVILAQAEAQKKRKAHEAFEKEAAERKKVPIWGYRTDGTLFGDAPPRRYP